MCGNEDRTGVWGADPRGQDKRRQRGSVQRTTTFPNFYPDEVHPTLLNRHPLCFYSCNQFAGCTGLSKVQGESHFILLHTAFQISSTKSSLLIGNNVPITQVTKTAISYSVGAASGWETCVMSGPLGHCPPCSSIHCPSHGCLWLPPTLGKREGRESSLPIFLSPFSV